MPGKYGSLELPEYLDAINLFYIGHVFLQLVELVIVNSTTK